MTLQSNDGLLLTIWSIVMDDHWVPARVPVSGHWPTTMKIDSFFSSFFDENGGGGARWWWASRRSLAPSFIYKDASSRGWNHQKTVTFTETIQWNFQQLWTWPWFMPMAAREATTKSRVSECRRSATFTTIQSVKVFNSVADKTVVTVAFTVHEQAPSPLSIMRMDSIVCGKSKACIEFQMFLDTNHITLWRGIFHNGFW